VKSSAENEVHKTREILFYKAKKGPQADITSSNSLCFTGLQTDIILSNWFIVSHRSTGRYSIIEHLLYRHSYCTDGWIGQVTVTTASPAQLTVTDFPSELHNLHSSTLIIYIKIYNFSTFSGGKEVVPGFTGRNSSSMLFPRFSWYKCWRQ